MNKTFQLGLAVVAAVLLVGCPEQAALSLHGLDAATAVAQEDLAGFWIVEPESVQVAEEANEDDPPSEQKTSKRPLRETYVDIVPVEGDAGRYTVTIRRGRQTTVLDARLVELTSGRIFDCRVVDTTAREEIEPHYQAPHSFFKIE